MTVPPRKIRLWSPHPSQIFSDLRVAVATCLSSAFSSGVWATSPIPLGHEADRDSAYGIIAEFDQKNILALVASDLKGQHLLGCVLGGFLDEDLICAYRLGAYGARIGDGLLAYIGVSPSAQGSRVGNLGENTLEILADHIGRVRNGESLAGLLFTQWLELSTAKSCSKIFVRTRKEIPAVLHLLEKNGFECHGQFELAFRGNVQERLVFSLNRDLS